MVSGAFISMLVGRAAACCARASPSCAHPHSCAAVWQTRAGLSPDCELACPPRPPGSALPPAPVTSEGQASPAPVPRATACRGGVAWPPWRQQRRQHAGRPARRITRSGCWRAGPEGGGYGSATARGARPTGPAQRRGPAQQAPRMLHPKLSPTTFVAVGTWAACTPNSAQARENTPSDHAMGSGWF